MVKSVVRKVILAELVEDTDLYPRHCVDGMHVSYLENAILSGAQLPRIVADKSSKRIVDGWHRRRAYQRVLGEAGEIEVEFIDYKDEAAMVFDAVRLNASHGRRLERIDQTRCVIMLRSRNYSDADIKVALNTTDDGIRRLTVRMATTASGSSSAVPGTNRIALKVSAKHLVNRELTPDQERAHKMFPGTSFLLTSRQLIAALQNDMLNFDDERLVVSLHELRCLLIEKLPAVKQPC